MPTRNVNTSELAQKYSMNPNTVKTVLKKAKVKPVSITKTAKREFAEWPNRPANAALRNFRAAVPVYGRISGFNSKKKVSAADATVTNISEGRLARRITQLAGEVADLRQQLRMIQTKAA